MKNSKDLRIVFMGTPEFATTILKKLYEEGYNIVGCVTVPDKPAGRGRKVQESDVKKYAINQQIPLLQPTKLKDPDFLSKLQDINAELFVVVAFRMLPEVVWKMPSLGTINLHGSLLPNYRGAAPINWAVINGENKTGVTSFYINENIDTGDILLQEEMPIYENETAGEVHDRMMHLGAEVILNTIDQIANGSVQPIPQQQLKQNAIKKAPKIFKEDCKINLQLTPSQIINFIHGLSPYPGAWIEIEQTEKREKKLFKIYKAKLLAEQSNQKLELKIDQKRLILKHNFADIELTEIQLQGKRKMKSKEFIAGFRPEEWEIIL